MKNIDTMNADELRAELKAIVARAQSLQHYANITAPSDFSVAYAMALGIVLPKDRVEDDEEYIPDSLDEAETPEEEESWFEHQQMMAEDLHDRMKEDGA